MSNRRKLDLAKLARVLAADMVRQSTTRPSVTVTPRVAKALEARGWERDQEFTVTDQEADR